MMLSQKKILGVAGIAVCIFLLIAVGIGAITWRLFWVAIILVAGFAWFVLPKMKEPAPE